jgi:hypothetical protein
MNSVWKLLLFTATLFVSALVARPQSPIFSAFEGTPYDIDFLGRQGWTQVLFEPTGGGEVITKTSSPLIEEVLLAAVAMSKAVRATYRPGAGGEPNELQSVELQAPDGCGNLDCVEKLRCDSGKATCFASLRGRTDEIATDQMRALGILLLAMRQRKGLEGVEVDKHSFVRVKVNYPRK